MPYVNNEQIFLCPNYSNTLTYVTNGYCVRTYGQDFGVPGLRGGYGVACYTTGATTGRTIADIEKPSNLILFNETTGGCTHHTNPGCGCSDVSTNGVGFHVDPRHNEGANFTFVDGHVKWLRKETVLRNDEYWSLSG